MSYKPIYMDDPRFDIISNMIYKSYPNACILYIDEVVNPELQKKFEARRELMSGCKIGRYFHGTREENINNIALNGFDPTLNTRAVYGYGVYFAENASYSKDYMFSSEPGKPTYMFLSDVLVGRKGTGGKRGDPGIDNNTGPGIITTVYPDGAFPRFIIAFHKEAR